MKARELIGYLMGLILFVILVPLIMWKLSGEVHPNAVRLICLGVMAAIGIGLSIWSIIYMKNVGEGNPMDAFNHEVAPRTVNLMTDGPYRLCRNPMLLGVFIYYVGVIIYMDKILSGSNRQAVIKIAITTRAIYRQEKKLLLIPSLSFEP